MEHTARIFNCTRCHRQVIICGCCDRGNIYCGPTCSQESRKESLRVSEKRYQNTYRGKLNHAKRQKRYQELKRKIMTDHSSKEISISVLLQSETNECVDLIHNNEIHCHFCGRICDSSLRMAFLAESRLSTAGVWPLGP
jgi:hypothetical protein